LTSYPFLLKNPCDCLEIDDQHLVSFKQENLRTWQNQGKLPLRNLSFFAADLHNPGDLDRVKQTLKSTIQERPSYVLMEGITYYLDLTVIQQILDILGQYQTSSSIFACDFWTPDMINNPAFLKLETYFVERFGYGTNHYTFLEPTWFNSLKSYQVLALTDVVEQEKQYNSTNILEQHQPLILRENYAILTKIALGT
jgi:O-methyltransferase involved in polyketide biosynthesis